MPKFRKKPVVVEAWKWGGKTLDDAKIFTHFYNLPNWRVGSRKGMTGLIIPTLEGIMLPLQGTILLKEYKVNFTPVNQIFLKRLMSPANALTQPPDRRR